MTKPTLRLNGRHMVTVRVDFHVTRDEAVDILTMARRQHLRTRLTKPRLLDELRWYFYLHGESEVDPDNYTPHDEREELREWASGELSRLFPDWT
jgi:hypothetical protein